MLKTFKGGINLPGFKSLTKDIPIKEISLPNKVIIPLIEYENEPCESKVKVDDKVKTGQLIAQSKKIISSPIHASISGTVTAIEYFPHPELEHAKGILIKSDELDEKAYIQQRRDYRNLSKDEIIDIIREAGVVGMGGAAFPTYIKLTLPKGKKVDSFIINLFECEPYLTVDYRVALEKTDEILEGINIILKVLDANFAYIGIGGKKEVRDILKDKIKNFNRIKMVRLKTKYPQGEEKQLIKSVLNRTVPKGKLPVDVGVVVNNVQTILAVYEAVCLNKPMYEKVITVTGEGIREPKNIRVRVGTLLEDIIKECGGVTKEEIAIIFGGPMMGKAQKEIKTPVIKGTSGILVLPKEKLDFSNETFCIRCGKCIEICPMRLMPAELNKLIMNKKWDKLEEFYISECMECGACTYLCPAKIPIIKRIKLGKQVTSELKQAKNLSTK